jgi:PAB-dependent poly(A)-specific ribonuclease subunit 3
VLYKALTKEGYPLALRRFDNVRCSHSIAQAASMAWKQVKHPAVVKLLSCYTQGRAVFFVHEYLAGAVSLRDRYLDGTGAQISDRIMWSYITQLIAVLRNIHGNQMACRCLTPSHVLRTSGGRLRVSCVGVVDVLEFEARKQLADLQREDIRDLGRLILALATRTAVPPGTDVAGMQKAAAVLQAHYPADLYQFTINCLSKPMSIFDVCSMAGVHVFDELDVVQSVADSYETQLSKEYESGRSLRLLLKLGFVNERPELGIDKQWAETGDRYVLKLFRDYVFHQTDAEGNPVMDLGHVVSSLNKLDCGDNEKICLSSRDGQALLVVSYADVARCLEGAYEELCMKNVLPQPQGGGPGGIATMEGGAAMDGGYSSQRPGLQHY